MLWITPQLPGNSVSETASDVMIAIAFALLPWLLFAALGFFMIWAIVTLIGILRQLVVELRGINQRLEEVRGRGGAGIGGPFS